MAIAVERLAKDEAGWTGAWAGKKFGKVVLDVCEVSMSGDVRGSDSLPRSFVATRRDRRRWRHAMKSSHTDRIYHLLKTVESDLLERTRRPADMRTATWLLKYRVNFRWVIQFGLLEPIKLYVADCPREMLPVAVWLWGRCANRFRLYGLSAFVNDPSPVVRKHLAKALRRLEAWTLLNEMAAAHPDDEKVQWFATARTSHRVFADRLQNFMTAVDSSRAEEVTLKSRMPFWSKDQSWERTPPTSVLFIRRMLVRIRRWVRLGVS